MNDSKLIVYESKCFPWPSRINFIPFRIFRGALFQKPITGQELFFCCFLQQTGSMFLLCRFLLLTNSAKNFSLFINKWFIKTKINISEAKVFHSKHFFPSKQVFCHWVTYQFEAIRLMIFLYWVLKLENSFRPLWLWSESWVIPQSSGF